jgi:thermostable 8-oxoguanine DNA glycosylase
MNNEIRDSQAISIFNIAKTLLAETGYNEEVQYFRDLPSFEKCTPEQFFNEYVWCVLNAGMKEQVARKIYDRFMEMGNLETIGHLGKRAAIYRGICEYPQWFRLLQGAPDKIEYLQTLPWIGPITKYHLARNIGIDCVKPDRHLVKLASQLGFSNATEMCETIKKFFPEEKLGTIDVILWRYCNLGGNK